MNRYLLTLIACCLLYASSDVLARTQGDVNIEQVIQKAYIQGVFVEGNGETIRSGFHPSFVMLFRTEDGVGQRLLEDWISGIEKRRAEKKQPEKKPEVRGKVKVLDITGNAAIARVKVFRDGKHIYTDFMSLYRFENGWKIVGKIFHSHR